jgi:hypothetical protein
MLVWPGMTPSWRSKREEMNMDFRTKRLEDIRAELKPARDNAAKARRAAREARETREHDPYKKDLEWGMHLQNAAMWDQRVADLEHAERCAGGSVGAGEWRPAGPGFVGSDH